MTRYFEIKPILDKYPSARYYFLLGGRSTGKTYPTIKKAIEDALDGKGLFAYVRRHKESLMTANISATFSVHDKFIDEHTQGRWNHIAYYQRRFWLERWETNPETGVPEKLARDPRPIGAVFSLATWETDKGGDFGHDDGIANIIIDEVLSKAGQYLPDEWSIVQNVISTLVRDRWEMDTKIFMLANPISKWANPYFRNMGISKKLLAKFGITEIQYPDDDGGIAMTAIFIYMGATANDIDPNKQAVYNTFFAFTHSKGKSKSITHGYWEMDDSARLPGGVYSESTKNRTVYAIFGEEKLGIDVMRYDAQSKYYLMIYPVTEIRPKTYYMVLGTSLDKYAVVGRDDQHPITRLIMMIYNTGQVYYSDDSTADAWHGFLIERNKYRV